MWIYYQSTGNLLKNGLWVTKGYAGNGDYKNNSDAQSVKDHGPLPRGLYFMKFVDTEKGPNTIHLEPSAFNEMFGRSGFLVHGDNPDHIGESSDGCIVVGPAARSQMVEDMSLNNLLCVV